MKKKILFSTIVLSLSIGLGVGAAELTLKGKKEQLEMQFGQSIERFWVSMDDTSKIEQEEMKRMEDITRVHLNNQLQEKKQQIETEQREKIAKETDKHIADLKQFIDQQLGMKK